MGKIIEIIGAMVRIIKENWDIILAITIPVTVLCLLVLFSNDPAVIGWFSKSILNMNIGDICMILFINSLLRNKKSFFKLKIESTPEKNDKTNNQVL